MRLLAVDRSVGLLRRIRQHVGQPHHVGHRFPATLVVVLLSRPGHTRAMDSQPWVNDDEFF